MTLVPLSGLTHSVTLVTAIALFTFAFAGKSLAQETDFADQVKNPRGSTTGPTAARGSSHPNQFLHVKPVKVADNMEPVLVHESDMKEARDKLAALEKKTA